MIESIVNHMGEKHKVWARPAIYRNGVEIGIMKEVPAHSVPSTPKPEPGMIEDMTHIPTKFYDAHLEWKEAEWGSVQINQPSGFAILPYELAQQMMDALWDAGVRPAAAMGSLGQLGATEKHLDDLRKMNERLLDKVLQPVV